MLMLSFSTASWSKTYIDSSAGLGFNSNIYRAPASDYVDFFTDRTGGTIVTPVVHSGFFVPLNIDVTHENRLDKKWSLIADYDFRNNLYLNERFRNANKVLHKGTLGTKYKIHNFKKRKSSIYTGLILGDKKRDYYDRDTGENQERVNDSGLEDVSDLYSFSTVGLEFEYKYWRKLDWNLNIDLRIEQRDYATVAIGSEYDHRFTRFKINYNYRFNKIFRLAIDYSFTNLAYDERSARNLHGQLFSRHPLLEYDVERTGFSFSQRIDKNIRFKYGYKLTARKDLHVGYNDYKQNELFTSVRYKFDDRLFINAGIILRDRKYANAWNFDRDPTLNPAITDTSHKSASSIKLTTEIEYTLNSRVILFGSAEYSDNQNSDDRYEYNRISLMLGANIKLL